MTKNWALVIGINAYNPLNFTPLKYAKQDAARVRDFFQSAGFEVCFFADDSTPITLPNGGMTSTQPTYGNLITFLQDRFKARFLDTGDNCWFFFAGHGERYQDRDYLMPMDANSRGTEIFAGLSVSFVEERLSRCGADNVIIILDACRNEGSRGGIGIDGDTQKGLIKISSCQPTQKSWEIDELQQGAFTYALLEALQLTGDSNCDTVERLGGYLKRRVPALCQHYGKAPVQIPRISADPIEKQHFILVTQQIQQADIVRLKLDAYRLKQINPILAEQICIRLNALTIGKDLEVVDLLIEIRSELKKQAASNTANIGSERVPSSSEEPNPVISPLIPLVERKELHECDPSRILFTKNVRPPNGNWAYTLERIQQMGFPVENRVFEIFWSSNKKSIISPSKGDLMLLIQQAKITHIVEILDDDIRENEVGYFRWVRAVWMPEKKDWAGLPDQEKILGFRIKKSVAEGSSFANSDFVDFHSTCWHSLDVFQQHIFWILASKESSEPDNNDASIDNLSSEQFGANYYTRLRDLLATQDWEVANQETLGRMSEVMDASFVYSERIEKFPCLDLCNIDRLWVKYSKGKFGFSVQKEIWQGCGSPTSYNRDWEKFGAAVGWQTKGVLGRASDWLKNPQLSFINQSAPRGHLPGGLGSSFFGFWTEDVKIGGWGRYYGGRVGVLFPRVKACRL